MKNEIVKIDPKEFGLEESKAKQIADQFKPMLNKMVELENEANEVFKMDIKERETALKAKEVRLKYVKVRTGTSDIHKKQKAFYLAGGRFVDGWKNAQIFASQGIEDRLKEIEDHEKIKVQQRIKKLSEERTMQIEKYDVDTAHIPVGTMDEDVWVNYLNGVKLAHEQKIEAENKAEAERIAKEKAYKEEQERIKKENERLKREADEREKVEAERKTKEYVERKEREEEDKKEREAYEAKLKAEREEKEIIKRELKLKEAEEKKAQEAQEKRIQDELNKDDTEKVKDLVNDLESLKSKYVFKSAKNKKMYSDTLELIDKIVSHIKG